MKKKSHAAIAIALVTSGLSSQIAKAGLTGMQNPNFDYDLTYRTPSYTYNNTIAGWYKTTGGPFANYYADGTTWYSQSQVAITGGVGNAYAVLQGDGTNPGGIFQSVGTFIPNYNVSVSLNEGYVTGATGHNLIVSLYSGGKPSSTYTTGYGTQWGNSALSGATLLGTETIADNGTQSFNAASFTLNTGTAGTTGSSLWLEITTDATDNTQLAVNNVVLSGATVYNPVTWTGAVNTTWDSSTANFTGTSTVFSNGSDAIFNDVAAGKSAITLSGTVMPATITFNNNASNYSITGSGTIAGGTSLTKNGTGLVTISTSNSFTGPVSVNAGGLILQNGAALGTSQSVTVNSGAMLELNTASGVATTFTNNLYLAGSGPAGQGALVNLSGSNTFAGTADLGTGQATINVSSGTLAFGGSIYGTGGLTKIGAGEMDINAFGKYFGDINILGGKVVVNYYNSISSTNVNVSSGATLVAPTSFALECTNLNIYGGTVQASAGDAIGYGGAGNQVFNVNITNGGVFNIADSHNEGYDTQWNLTGGSITSTGGGYLNIASGDSNPGTGINYGFTSLASNVTSVISAPIGIRSGTPVFTIAQGTTPNGIDLEVSGPIGAPPGYSTPSGGIDKEGPGTLALTGSDTFTGTIVVNGGTLMFGDGTVGHDGSISPNASLNNNASVVFDTYSSQSFAGSISGSGTLTKMGPGTLVLSGGGAYGGATNVASGKLYITTNGLSSSGFNVASGATLGGTAQVETSVNVASGGIIEAGQFGVGQLSVNGLTFNGSGTINIGTLNNYSGSPALQVNGTLSTARTNSVAIAVSDLTGISTGTAYQLIGYSGESGPGVGSYTLSLPRGDIGSLSDTGSQVDLTLSSIGGAYAIVWTGANSTAWDTTTPNWKYNGSPTDYINTPGDPVVFDDTAGSNQTVNISSGSVSPASVTFNNSTYSYMVIGSSGIAGNTGITLNGTGKVTLSTVNTFTGPVTLNAGTLAISSDANLGAVPATATDDVFLNGGTLAFNSSVTLSANRNINASGGTINLQGNTVSIPGTVDGSGALIVTSTGSNGSSGVLLLNNPSGNTATGPLIINSGTVDIGVAGVNNYGSAEQFSTINLSSGATLVFEGVNTFGYAGAGSFKPAIYINGGTVTNTNTDNYLGGQITMTGGTINGLGNFRLIAYTPVSSNALVTTNPASTTATISVPSLYLYSNADFNVSSGTVPSKVDLLISSVIGTPVGYTTGIIKDGTGTLVLSQSNSYNSGTTINSGLLVASAGLGSLGVPSGVATATVNGGGLILRNTSAGTVYSMIQTGFNGGAWDATSGITSTAAAADTTLLHAVGMLQPATTTTFEGQTLYSTDVAIKYTYYGDANLDGKVDGSDYSIIDNSYEMEKTSGTSISGWQYGDFNYDGVVDGSDYTLIDNAFNSQGTQISAEVASPTALLAGGSAAVPEPASLGLLGIGAIGLLGRRRRR